MKMPANGRSACNILSRFEDSYEHPERSQVLLFLIPLCLLSVSFVCALAPDSHAAVSPFLVLTIELYAPVLHTEDQTG